MGLFKNKKDNIDINKIDKVTSNKVSLDCNRYKVSLQNNNCKPSVVISDYEIDLDLSKMVEINNLTIMSKSNALLSFFVPETIGKINNSVLSKELLASDIPFKDLTKSKAFKSAKRGFVLGNEGIIDQANFSKVNTQKAKVANGVGTAFNVVSFVVGQYNMVQIGKELQMINNNLNEIISYNKFKELGEIKMLIEVAESLSKFQIENMNNEELRKQAISQIVELRNKTISLLNKTNLEIQSITNSNVKKLDDFKNKLEKILYRKQCQQLLFSIIEKLGELDYAYNRGDKSLENAFCFRNKQLEECNLIADKIKAFNSIVLNIFVLMYNSIFIFYQKF